MRFEQLEYLIAVHDYGSMHEAARQLHVSQQCISKALKDLETELNVKIFERKNKGSIITEAGKDIYIHAVNIEKEISYLHNTYTLGNQAVVEGHLNIFCPISYGTILESIIMDICKRNPLASINLIENDSLVLMELLRNNHSTEVMLIQSSMETMLKEQQELKESYNCFLIKKEQLKVLMSRSSPYAQRKTISKQVLLNLPFALKTNMGEVNSTYLNILQENNLDINIQFRSNSVLSMMKLITQNAAYAFATDSTFSELYKKQSLCTVPIRGVYVYLFLLFNKENRSPITDLFIDAFAHKFRHRKRIF